MPHLRFYLRCAVAVLVAATLFAAGFGQVPRPPIPTPFPSSTLLMTVTDENGVVVPYAWCSFSLLPPPPTAPLTGSIKIQGLPTIIIPLPVRSSAAPRTVRT